MNENKDVLKSEEVQAMSNQFAERLQKEEKANEVYETFLKSCGLATFEFEPFELEGETYEACKLGEGKVDLKAEDYPDYYGGAYINEDGDLVIHVVGSLEPCQAKAEKVIGHQEGYVVKQARYRYQDLMKLKEYLDELEMNEKQKEIFANVTGYGPSDQDNLFLVEMNVLDEAHIAAFKKYLSDSEMVMFRQGSFDVEETTIRPGRIITRGNTIIASTLTIRARRSLANQGFIMSGHGTTATGETIRLNGIPTIAIGTVRNRQVGGSVDSAYVQRVNNNIVLSNLIEQNRHVLTSATATAAVNTTVHLAGQASGIRSGRVTAINVTTHVNGVPLAGSRANYFSQNGDSGGPIYRNINGSRRIVGVHARSNGHFALIGPTIRAFGIQLF